MSDVRWISSVSSYCYPWIVRHLVHRGLDVLETMLGAGTAFLAGDRPSLAGYNRPGGRS